MHIANNRATALGFIIAFSTTALLFACSSSKDTATPAGDASVDGSAADGQAGDAPAAIDSGGGGDSSEPPPGTLTINEIAGKGDEWVEVINTGTTPVDVSAYKVTDGDKDGGAPNKGNAATFPTGTTIPSGGYVVVMGWEDGGTYPDGGLICSAPAGVPCYKGTFSISNSGGDTVYLLNPANGTITQVKYPGNTITSGHSWGRLPNGTGAFQQTTKTAGVANKP